MTKIWLGENISDQNLAVSFGRTAVLLNKNTTKYLRKGDQNTTNFWSKDDQNTTSQAQKNDQDD